MCYTILKVGDKMTIGENIRKIRKKSKLTQKQLGELCGINEANIRKYELGKANPKYETLKKIANALNVTPLILIEGPEVLVSMEDENNIFSENNYIIHKGELEHDLLDTFWKLNDYGKKEAYKRIDELSHIPKYVDSSVKHNKKLLRDLEPLLNVTQDTQVTNVENFFSKEHLTLMAAHNDNTSDEELKKIREDMEYLKNLNVAQDTQITNVEDSSSKEHLTLKAAHQRRDIEVTEQMKKHDENIMHDKNF